MEAVIAEAGSSASPGWNGRHIFILCRHIGYRTAGWQHVIDHMHGRGMADQLCAEYHGPFGRLFQLREAVAQGDMHIISREAVTQATHGLFTQILWDGQGG